MTTETSYTLAQLVQIVSALEGERRNPNSKATALRASATPRRSVFPPRTSSLPPTVCSAAG